MRSQIDGNLVHWCLKTAKKVSGCSWGHISILQNMTFSLPSTQQAAQYLRFAYRDNEIHCGTLILIDNGYTMLC